MTINNTYMNVSLNTGYAGGTTAGYNNPTVGNPFIAVMQVQAQNMAAQYKQMTEYRDALMAQLAERMKANAAANPNNNTQAFSYSAAGSISNNNNIKSSVWTQNNRSSYVDTASDLKPGLFKGRLAGQEALVTRLCRKYGLDPGLVAAIIGLESGWGTSNLAMHNNFGGLRKRGDAGANAKGFGYFSTIEKGLEEMIKNLAKYPQRYGDISAVNLANLDAIGRRYCEGGHWANQVRNVYHSRVTNYLA